MKQKTFQIIQSKPAYHGFFKLNQVTLKHSLFAGGESAVIQRELLDHGQAVAVLMYDPVKELLVMIEQFRIGAMSDPQGAWLLELAAGMAEAGEDLASVAKREAMEETGCEIHDLIEITKYYPSAGGSTETVTIFCARVDSTTAGDICGLAEEGEDIKVHLIPVGDILQDIYHGPGCSAAVMIALQWFSVNRAMLQARYMLHGEA